MQIIKIINQVLAFILELVMFVSIGYYGYNQGNTVFTKWIVAIACSAMAITLWGFFAAPNSQTRLHFPIRLVFELVMFLLAAFLLYKLNHPTIALSIAIMAIIIETISYIFRQ